MGAAPAGPALAKARGSDVSSEAGAAGTRDADASAASNADASAASNADADASDADANRHKVLPRDAASSSGAAPRDTSAIHDRAAIGASPARSAARRATDSLTLAATAIAIVLALAAGIPWVISLVWK